MTTPFITYNYKIIQTEHMSGVKNVMIYNEGFQEKGRLFVFAKTKEKGKYEYLEVYISKEISKKKGTKYVEENWIIFNKWTISRELL